MDTGIEAFDLFRRQKLRISERSATRQLALGDLVLGWLCKDAAGALTLEGGIAHVPAFVAPRLMPLVEELRSAMPPLANEQAWRQSAGELPLPLIAGILELRANPPLPELVNTSGDPLELVTGHYRIRDRARVVGILGRELEKNSDGSYTWVDDRGTALAHIEVAGGKLRVSVNSRNRPKAAQQLVEALLGDTANAAWKRTRTSGKLYVRTKARSERHDRIRRSSSRLRSRLSSTTPYSRSSVRR